MQYEGSESAEQLVLERGHSCPPDDSRARQADRNVRAHLIAFLLTVLGAFWLAGCASSGAGSSAVSEPPRSYLRKVRTAEGTLKLEVSARAFRPMGKRGPVVWLVGVTHLGEPAYYHALQQFLNGQSLVLFEGIGATNRQFQLERDDTYSLQADLAQSLGLQFQLDAIDYNRANFQNCDLTVEQLFRLLHPRAAQASGGPATTGQASVGPASGSELNELLNLMQGEGFLGMLARFGVGLIAASPQLQATVKVVMIETFDALPADLQGLRGVPPGMQRLMRLLIDERNQAVLTGLEHALSEKPRPHSVAVFYGAGHMTDLEKRIRDHWHCRPVENRWFTAFSANPRDAGVSEFELNMIRSYLHQQLGATNAPANSAETEQEDAR